MFHLWRRRINYKKVAFYGKDFGFQAEETFVKSSQHDSGSPIPTLNFDIFPLISDSNNPSQGKKGDWDKKMIFQLSKKELPILCSVLLGYLPKIEIKRPDKGIEIVRQPGNLFVRASGGKGRLYVLPIDMSDTFQLSSFALSRLQEQVGGMDDALLLASLRGAAGLYKA